MKISFSAVRTSSTHHSELIKKTFVADLCFSYLINNHLNKSEKRPIFPLLRGPMINLDHSHPDRLFSDV